MNVSVSVRVCAYIYTHTHIHIQKNKHIHTHTYSETQTHTHTCDQCVPCDLAIVFNPLPLVKHALHLWTCIMMQNGTPRIVSLFMSISEGTTHISCRPSLVRSVEYGTTNRIVALKFLCM